MSDRFSIQDALPATGDREDFYTTLKSLMPTSALVDGVTIKADGGVLAGMSSNLRWVKYSVTYADFTAAGTVESIALFSLVASGMIERVVIDVTEAWVIAGMATLALTVGISGTPDKYTPSASAAGASLGITGFSAIADNAPESMADATSILLTATSNTGNLSTATAGAADVYVLRGDLINL